MFDIGLGEMILLAAIALIAIGPKQLPEVARVVGRMLNELKRATGDLTRSVVDARESVNQSIHQSLKEDPSKQNDPPSDTLKKAPKVDSGEGQMSFDIQAEAGESERKNS